MVNQKFYQLGTAPSVIRELFAYGLEQAQVVGPENVFDYSLGNPSIPAPAKVNQSIHDILNDTDSIRVHGYSVACGFDSAREAIAANLNRRFGMELKPGNLFLTCGAAPGLIAVIKALLAEEDSEIMAVAPFFPEYRVFVEANGAKLVVVPPHTSDFQIDFEALEKAISAHTKGVIINSPNNPSGAVYSKETIRKLAALLTKKSEENGTPIFILADEPYREIAYDGVEVPYVTKYYANTLVCYSYSKSLSLPGERIGYVIVPDEVTESKTVYAAIAGAGRALGYVCAPSMFQKVIAACVGNTGDIELYKKNRDLLYDGLTKIGYECFKPQGAFYMFVKALEPDADAFCERAKEQDLLIVSATGFGCPGYARVSYCVDYDMIERSFTAFEKLYKSYQG